MSTRFRLPLALFLGLLVGLVSFAPGVAQPLPPAPVVEILHLDDDGQLQPGLPPEVLIGEDFHFKLRVSPFPSASFPVGYGPFVELYLQYTGADCNQPISHCDGLQFGGATAQFTTTQLTLPACPSPPTAPFVPGVDANVCLPLPTAGCPGTSTSKPACFFGSNPTLCPFESAAGFQKVVLPLPFGSFVLGQPPVLVDVAVHVDSFADDGFPLTVRARGGFQFGASAVGGLPSIDAACPMTATSLTTPRVLRVHKKYLGPEDETATGPNFPVTYELSVDVAKDQTVDDLKLVDCLPGGLTFIPGSAPPGSTFLGGCLTVNAGTVTGGGAHPDRTYTFQAYVPEVDPYFETPILGPSCKAFVPNQVTATAEWMPSDQRDPPLANVTAQDDHPITAKCLALQKSVKPVNDTHAPGATPGDSFEFRLDFEISDFKTFGSIVLDDYLADGWTLFGVPVLTLSDKFTGGATLTGPIVPQLSVYQDAATGDVYTCNDGTRMFQPRHLRFDVSAALAALGSHPRHDLGIVTGGLAGLPFGGLAKGTITFRARIADFYSRQPVTPPNLRNVKKDDTLPNCAVVQGDVLANADAPALPLSVIGAGDDDSRAEVTVVTGLLRKSIFALNGNPPPPLPSPPLLAPGDAVTFRLTLPIPSSDTTGLSFQDFLPLPVFPAPILNGPLPCTTLVPGPGAATARPPLCSAPILAGSGIPVASTNLGSNSVLFNYPLTLSQPLNTLAPADILFTVTASAAPYADGLHLNNHVIASERNTFGVTFSQTEVADLVMGEPKLRIRKGIVSVNDPSAVFQPGAPVPLGVVFDPQGGFTGVINSNNVGSALNSDVTNAQGCDQLLYVIVVENLGSSPKGAFDVQVTDLVPPCLRLGRLPRFHVTRGDGTPLTCNGGQSCSSSPLFFSGITLDDTPGQGSLAPYHPTSGANLAVITFNASLPCNALVNGCCTNTANLVRYAGVNGGPNHVAANFSTPYPDTAMAFTDTASVCIQPKVRKSIAATSESSTLGSSVTIGEVIRYRLEVELPVGTAPLLTFNDTLPPGQVWMPGSCALATQDPALLLGTPSPVFSFVPFTPFLAVHFGTVTNPQGGPHGALLAVECNVLVLNSPPGPTPDNHLGDQRSNTFTASIKPRSGPKVTFQSNVVTSLIAEPAGVLVKKEAAGSSGSTITYQLSYTNSGTSTAFDVVIRDRAQFFFMSLSSVSVSPSSCQASVISGFLVPDRLLVRCPAIPPGGTVNVQFSTHPIFPCQRVSNTATLSYSSLPGSNGTIPNPTGGFPPGASGTPRGERTYTSSASLVVQHCPDLALEKSHTPELSSTGSGFQTFTVTNVGDAPSFPPMTVTDTLPPGMAVGFGPLGGNGWTCTVSGSTITCTNPNPLPPGGSSTFQIPVFLTDFAPNGVTNCASAATAFESNVANNRDCDTVTTCVRPPPGLLDWYPLDETQGPFTEEFLFKFNIGIYIPQTGPAAPVPMPGKVEGGICFNGQGGYVRIGTNPFDPGKNDPGSGDLTLDAWIRTTTRSGTQALIDKRQSSPDLRGYSLFLRNGQLGLQLANGAGSSNCSTSPTSACTEWIADPIQGFVADGNWRLVAVTVQRNQPNGGRFYVDGVLAGIFDPTVRQGSLTNGADLWLGAAHPLSGGPISSLTGCLDEVEIFGRALSAEEIQAIFKAGPLGKCKINRGP